MIAAVLLGAWIGSLTILVIALWARPTHQTLNEQQVQQQLRVVTGNVDNVVYAADRFPLGQQADLDGAA